MKSQTLYKNRAPLEGVPKIAKDILKLLPKNAVIALEGDLAAGKTALVDAIVKELNLGSATSPTFSLQQVYGEKVFHYDFYRVNFKEIAALGLIDEFEKEGLHFAEWADENLINLLVNAGFNVFCIKINKEPNQREYILEELHA